MKKLAMVALLAACGTDDNGGPGANADPAHQACVEQTNVYRDMDDKPSLSFSEALQDYANEGAMVDFGTSPHHHFSTTNGGGIAFAENECPQQGNWTVGSDLVATVKACVKAFYDEGPGGGHYDNMMGPYLTIGCGIYQSGNKVTIIQEFGK